MTFDTLILIYDLLIPSEAARNKWY